MELISQIGSFQEGYRLEIGRKRKQENRRRLREERGSVLIRNQQNEFEFSIFEFMWFSVSKW